MDAFAMDEMVYEKIEAILNIYPNMPGLIQDLRGKVVVLAECCVGSAKCEHESGFLFSHRRTYIFLYPLMKMLLQFGASVMLVNADMVPEEHIPLTDDERPRLKFIRPRTHRVDMLESEWCNSVFQDTIREFGHIDHVFVTALAKWSAGLRLAGDPDSVEGRHFARQSIENHRRRRLASNFDGPGIDYTGLPFVESVLRCLERQRELTQTDKSLTICCNNITQCDRDGQDGEVEFTKFFNLLCSTQPASSPVRLNAQYFHRSTPCLTCQHPLEAIQAHCWHKFGLQIKRRLANTNVNYRTFSIDNEPVRPVAPTASTEGLTFAATAA